MIKKLGKIILDHPKYFKGGSRNPGFDMMTRYLSRTATRDKRDKFNTYALKLILESQEP